MSRGLDGERGNTYTIINASQEFEWHEWQRSIILRKMMSHARPACCSLVVAQGAPRRCLIALLFKIVDCSLHTLSWREVVAFDLLQAMPWRVVEFAR